MDLFRKRRTQADFTAEIETHIVAEIDRLREDGMSALDAERAARRKFGNVLRAQERFYETGRILWLEDLRKDVRQALRQFQKSPVISVTIAGMLALGIGATTAVFSIVDAVLLRPSPYSSAERLCGSKKGVPAIHLPPTCRSRTISAGQSATTYLKR